MTEHKELTRTLVHAVDRELEWDTISIINGMLKDMNVNAQFTTQQQNTHFDKKDGCLLTLEVRDE